MSDPQLYSRHIKNVGYGLFVLRDFSMGRETSEIPDQLGAMAENNAVHSDACIIYANTRYTGRDGEFRYSMGHRGISPMTGHQAIAEVEFISQQ